MSDLGNHDMDLPLEPTSGQLVDAADAIICGGLVVMASVVDVPTVGPRPALVFRFAHAEGGLHRPMLLVLDDDQAAKLAPLVTGAIDMARTAATKAARP